MKYSVRGVRNGQKAGSEDISAAQGNVLRSGLFTKTTAAKRFLGWSNPVVHDLARSRGYNKLGLYKDGKLVSERQVFAE